MTDNEETNEPTEMKTTERGSGRPVLARRDLPPTKAIEVRYQNAERGGHGAAAQHGTVLGDSDPNRTSLVFESVGSSGTNAGKTLMSDFADGGNTIRGGASSTEIAIAQRSRLQAGATERTPETVAAEQARREGVTFEEKVARARRIIADRESLTAPEVTVTGSPRPTPVKRDRG